MQCGQCCVRCARPRREARRCDACTCGVHCTAGCCSAPRPQVDESREDERRSQSVQTALSSSVVARAAELSFCSAALATPHMTLIAITVTCTTSPPLPDHAPSAPCPHLHPALAPPLSTPAEQPQPSVPVLSLSRLCLHLPSLIPPRCCPVTLLTAGLRFRSCSASGACDHSIQLSLPSPALAAP